MAGLPFKVRDRAKVKADEFEKIAALSKYRSFSHALHLHLAIQFVVVV